MDAREADGVSTGPLQVLEQSVDDEFLWTGRTGHVPFLGSVAALEVLTNLDAGLVIVAMVADSPTRRGHGIEEEAYRVGGMASGAHKRWARGAELPLGGDQGRGVLAAETRDPLTPAECTGCELTVGEDHSDTGGSGAQPGSYAVALQRQIQPGDV